MQVQATKRFKTHFQRKKLHICVEQIVRFCQRLNFLASAFPSDQFFREAMELLRNRGVTGLPGQKLQASDSPLSKELYGEAVETVLHGTLVA